MISGEHEHDRFSRTVEAIEVATAVLGESGKSMVGFGWSSNSDETAFLASISTLLVEVGVQANARGLDWNDQIIRLNRELAAYAERISGENPVCLCDHPVVGEPHDVDGCTHGHELTMERCGCDHRSGLARTRVRAWVTPAVTADTDPDFH
ncbi:hypothetical protein [Curtobacterium flaccumfaciens]|uniref:hypothetical protein n=1 Tax=Curtobacterium flaccumfaciens TaxID=2035 RepID=UPI003B005156